MLCRRRRRDVIISQMAAIAVAVVLVAVAVVLVAVAVVLVEVAVVVTTSSLRWPLSSLLSS